MAFFQTDLDPLYLREKHRDTLQQRPINNIASSTQEEMQQSRKKHEFKFSDIFKSSTSLQEGPRITSDPMNRLVSFHL
jgi:hypothetical protein